MAIVRPALTFGSMRWRIIRHGPHDERVFGLAVGLLAAIGVIVLAALSAEKVIGGNWIAVPLALMGAVWLLGPMLSPGSTSIMEAEWFLTLPTGRLRIALSIAPSELMSVGVLVSSVAMACLVVVGWRHGPLVVSVALVAGALQVIFFLWLGRCAMAVTAFLMRTAWGVYISAIQMSLILALSFAGWVPFAALMLPELGEGSTAVEPVRLPYSLPAEVEQILLLMPSGWGFAAMRAMIEGAPLVQVLSPLAGLTVGALLLLSAWVAITMQSLRGSRGRGHQTSHPTAGNAPLQGLSGRPWFGVLVREIRTWLRDPARKMGLIQAWLTPLLMAVLIATTAWSWALPLGGVVSAAVAAMVAVNTYALDGTALWQIITTPRSIAADVLGRQLAWLFLLGLPLVMLTLLACIATASPLGPVAWGMTLAAIGASSGGAPLLSALMPAVGADARHRKSSTARVGNAAGGEYTAFTLVVGVAIVPLLASGLLGDGWFYYSLSGVAVGVGAAAAGALLTRSRLRKSGSALLWAFSAEDISKVR